MTEEEKTRLENFIKEKEGDMNSEGASISKNTKEEKPKIIDDKNVVKPWEKNNKSNPNSDNSTALEIGWDEIPIKDLPTQGLFYPEGTKIIIRAASGAEIRHWSSLSEEDLSALDDMLNYVIERCSAIKYPDNQMSSWKDLKEVDRFYVLLAIREKTFVAGENQLQVKISESENLTVTKEMIDYINFDERLMKYYDQEKRLIVLKFKNGKTFDLTLPSVGVTNFIKTYVQKKSRMQEPFDKDFLNFAPFVIKDWRMLNDASYEQIVIDSQGWSNLEVSMLTKVRDIFADTINPVVKYFDESGGERELPLNFLGGIKSIFLISDPFSQLI